MSACFVSCTYILLHGGHNMFIYTIQSRPARTTIHSNTFPLVSPLSVFPLTSLKVAVSYTLQCLHSQPRTEHNTVCWEQFTHHTRIQTRNTQRKLKHNTCMHTLVKTDLLRTFLLVKSRVSRALLRTKKKEVRYSYLHLRGTLLTRSAAQVM